MKKLLQILALGAAAAATPASALTWSLAGGNENWPADIRNQIIASMNEAVALYNANGYFDKHVTANYNPGVPTAQASYSGWIDFGNSRNTRTALHEIAHTLGVGQYWSFNGNAFTRGNELVKLYDGQGAGVGAGGGHFWPYGLNFDNEDGAVNRVRHCRMVAALRFDMGIVVDSDGDGMPDDWETFNFGNLSQTAAGDPDGDGVSNFDEYKTDTNPNVGLVKANRTYTFTPRHVNKVLNIAGASTANGGDAVITTSNGATSQKWTAYPVGGGWFKLVNVNSGKVLEVAGNSTAAEGNVAQWSWANTYSQQWRFADSGVSGYLTLANRNSGMVVAVYAMGTADGSDSIQFYDVRSDDQRWAPAEVLPLVNNAVYSLTALHSNKVLDVQNPNTADGANVGQWGWNGGNWQKWTAIDLGGGFVRFMSVHSGKALEIYNHSTANGGNAVQWSWWGGNTQQWRLEGTDNPGVYNVINRNSGLVLDVEGISTADGANVWQWQWLGGNNQKWKFDVR